MTIRVVTDSTCDLPPEVIKRLGITVVPMYINIDTQGYLDGVEISRAEFYQNLPHYVHHPTTATPGSERFREVYERLASEGASQVLSIHISISLSATVDVARTAAQQTDALPVTVLDSRQLSLGTGFLVEAAAEAANRGHSMEEILALLDDQIARTHVFAALDTLEFLRRSGRMNRIVFGLGSLLQIKPLLTMYDGQPGSERVRTRKRADLRVIEMLREKAPFERVALVHTHSPQRAAELRQLAGDLLPEGDLTSVDITPVIGAHIGPGAAGFACIQAAK
jgi:DegV family protein with EDD domain